MSKPVLLTSLLSLLLLSPLTVAGREAVPTDAAKVEARTVIEQTFPAVRSASTPQQRLELAQKLQVTAAETTDPAARFVLLSLARDQAIEAVEVDAALKVSDSLARNFEVDLLVEQSDTLTRLAAVARSEQHSREVARAALSAIDQAIQEDRLDVAQQLVMASRAVVARAKDGDLSTRAVAAGGSVAHLRREFVEVEAARETLSRSPDDSAANLVVGRYRCLAKGDWNGLLLLVKGASEDLAALAAKDLAGPTASAEQKELGDRWWALGDQETAIQKHNAQRRAIYWYEKALPSLRGLDKIVVERRIGQAMPSTIEPKTEPAQVDWVALPANLKASAWQRNRDWIVRQGGVIETSGTDSQTLWTSRPFGDFILEFEYRLAPESNSGVFLRTPAIDRATKSCIEVQLLASPKRLPAAATNGAFYSVQGASRDTSKSPGQWNHMRIHASGPILTVELNEVEINRINLDEGRTAGRNPNGSANRFTIPLANLERVGFIGFQGAINGSISFRNIRIRELP